MRRPYGRMIPYKEHKIKSLFDQGVYCKNIAEEVGLSRSTVSRWLRSVGLRRKNKTGKYRNIFGWKEIKEAANGQVDTKVSPDPLLGTVDRRVHTPVHDCT